jgi:hypothetical protein
MMSMGSYTQEWPRVENSDELNPYVTNKKTIEEETQPSFEKLGVVILPWASYLPEKRKGMKWYPGENLVVHFPARNTDSGTSKETVSICTSREFFTGSLRYIHGARDRGMVIYSPQAISLAGKKTENWLVLLSCCLAGGSLGPVDEIRAVIGASRAGKGNEAVLALLCFMSRAQYGTMIRHLLYMCEQYKDNTKAISEFQKKLLQNDANQLFGMIMNYENNAGPSPTHSILEFMAKLQEQIKGVVTDK